MLTRAIQKWLEGGDTGRPMVAKAHDLEQVDGECPTQRREEWCGGPGQRISADLGDSILFPVQLGLVQGYPILYLLVSPK